MSGSVRRRCGVEGDPRSIQQPDDHRSHRRSSAISLVCHVSPPVTSVPGFTAARGSAHFRPASLCSRLPPSPSLFSCLCSPFSLGQHVAGNSSQTSYVSVFLNGLRGASGKLIVVFAGPSSSSCISRWTCPSQSRVSGRLWGFLSCSLTTPLSFSLRYAKPLSRHLASHARFAR